MKKFSISDLNTESLNIVCKIDTYEEYDKLSLVCPNMVSYKSDYCYYITSRGGCSKHDNDYTYNSFKYYKIITLNDIDFDDMNFSNGIPLIWEINE